MNFDKINAMVDELNKNFDIIEGQTKALEEEQLENYKEIFKDAHKYFMNWVTLLNKVTPYSFDTVIIRTNSTEKGWHWIRLHFDGKNGDVQYDETRIPCSTNKAYYEAHIFTHGYFKNEVIPAIKSIDYDFIEKKLVEEINERITTKAERIEQRYNKAKEV